MIFKETNVPTLVVGTLNYFCNVTKAESGGSKEKHLILNQQKIKLIWQIFIVSIAEQIAPVFQV